MTHGNLIAGLDVGTTKICAVIAQVADGEQPNIIGVGTSPCDGLKKGVVVDLDKTSAAIKDAVTKAERMAGEEIQSVVVGVTGEHIACVNNRSMIAVNHPDREIGESDVARLLDTAKVIVLPPEREIIHAIPRWYSDGQAGIHSPVGMHGTRLEMETHIVTGLSSFLQNVVKCVHMAGFSVDATVLEPLAGAESVLVPAERELGVALVDIGGGTSDVAIYIDGQIYYSGVIPVGGSHFTRDLAVGLRSSIEEAERVKVENGQVSIRNEAGMEPFEFTTLAGDKPRHLPKKVLVEIIEPRMTELCHLVIGQIELAGCQDRLPAGIVFTGGGAQLKGLADLAAKVTGLPARIGKPVGFSGLMEAVSNPACATAAGLVLFWDKYYSREDNRSAGEGLVAGLIRRIKELFSRFGTE
ncbi:MAG TPA: cell division protein FtsA [Armatimonadota bacterium]|jgi:cell division protein FtsA